MRVNYTETTRIPPTKQEANKLKPLFNKFFQSVKQDLVEDQKHKVEQKSVHHMHM